MCKAMKDWAEDERAEGRTERDKETIAVLLRKGKSVEEIVDLCEYPEDLVREVEQSLLVTQ